MLSCYPPPPHPALPHVNVQPSPPVVHLFPHWNWAPGAKVDLWVFSNADSVELLVNGVSQGTKVG